MNARNAMHEIINFFMKEIYFSPTLFNAFRLPFFVRGNTQDKTIARKDVAENVLVSSGVICLDGGKKNVIHRTKK